MDKENCKIIINESHKNDLVKQNNSLENQSTGIIYCLTNTVNGKKYIGQALSYLINHGKIKRHGLEGRFKNHCKDALSGKDYCSKLYPAMRKYGIDKFVKEIVIITAIELLSDFEVYYIHKYDVIKCGYNISLGGNSFKKTGNRRQTRIEKIKATMIQRWKDPEYINKTIPANLRAVMKRANGGTLRTKNIELHLPSNIYKTGDGYDIRIMRDGKYKITSVTGKDLSDNDKLKQAVIKRDEILYNMKNDIDDSLHKKTDHINSELPKGIVKFKARGNEGYKVIVRHKGKRKEKNFTDGRLTMAQKLELAKKALIEMSKNKIDLINKPIDNRLDHNNNILPNNIVLVKKNDKMIGYSINYGKERKGFCTKEKTMNEKLELAKQHLIQLMGNPQASS